MGRVIIISYGWVDFPSSDRANISVSLLNLSMEHQRGIHTLVDKRILMFPNLSLGNSLRK